MTTTTLCEREQVTMPKQFRTKLGFTPGIVLTFKIYGKTLMVAAQKKMLRPLLGIGIYLLYSEADAVLPSGDVVVPGNKELFDLASVRRKPVREHPVPRLGVELHFAHLSAICKIAAVDDCIRAVVAEIFERRYEVSVRPPESVPSPIRPQVGIAQDAKDEIGLPGRLPSRRCGENPSSAKRERCRAGEKTPSRNDHLALIPCRTVHPSRGSPAMFAADRAASAPRARSPSRRRRIPKAGRSASRDTRWHPSAARI